MTGIEAGKAYVKFLLDDKDLKKGLTKVGQKLQSVGKIGLAATAPLIGAFAAATKAGLDYGDALGDMAARTGIAVKELSGLQYAAEQSDVEIATLERGIQRMTVNIGNAVRGTGTFAKTLGELGVSVAELQGLSPDQQFLRLSDAIASVENPTQRAALAQAAFGKSAQQLLPLLNQGSAGINDLTRKAEELGVVLTEQDVAALGQLDQALKTAKTQVFGLSVQIASAVAGPLNELLEKLQPIVATVIDWVQKNPELTKTIAGVTFAVAAASAATIALGSAMAAIVASPFVGYIAGVVGAYLALEGVVRSLNELFDAQLSTLNLLGKALDNIPTLGFLRDYGKFWLAVNQMPTETAAIPGRDIPQQAAALQQRAIAGMNVPTIAAAAVQAAGAGAIGGGPLEVVGMRELLGLEEDILRVLRGKGGLTVGGF